MQRKEFIFLIGFEGKNAYIDGAMARAHGRKTTCELAEMGYLKAAFCSALYAQDVEEETRLLQWFTEHDLYAGKSFEDLKSIFGVREVPRDAHVIKI